MIRGTTPTNVFAIDLDLTDADVVYITYKQGGETVIEKTKSNMTIDAEQITVELTQEETLRLRSPETVQIQIRARFSDGAAVASNIMTATVEQILKNGVI